MKRKFVKLAISAAMLGAMVAPQAAMAVSPAPALHDDNAYGKFGDWYTGAVPPNVDNSKPVLLFVQGLHSDYTTWVNSGDNYYDAAYNAGYRTAFVQLKDADGGGGDMWTNGAALADVIRKVSAYYGGAKINVIAHSKGGIDTQTALVYYGASPYVNVVHQLSTPNRGSELADLSYGSWTWWIGWIMGQQDDAVYSLQTSYMSSFRSWTDGAAENNATRTYMSAGTGDDGWFSAYWYAHAVLPGSDDGAVAMYSALGLPNGVYSFTDNGSQKLNHSQMAYASKTWWQVKPKLTTSSFASLASPMASASANKTSLEGGSIALPPVELSSNIMLGGQIDGLTTNTFTLESGLNLADVDIMTASTNTNVSLISPSGRVYKPSKAQAKNDTAMLYANASHNLFHIQQPEKGNWTLQAEGSSDAYFMLAQVDGGTKAKVTTKKKVHNPKADTTVSFDVNLEGGQILGKVKNAKLVKANANGRNVLMRDITLNADLNGTYRANFVTPTEPGVYNVSFDITGVNAQGEEFTRSVNYNFSVTDANGEVK